MSRSSRLQHTFMATSTTPRTTRSYLEELAKTYTPSPDEVLYNEAKLALGRGEVDAALALFQQVKKGYQNTSAYVAQCHTYRRLCDAGVVQRSRDSMRATLQALLPHACGMVLCKYSEVLRRHGYDSHMMEGLTLMQVDAVAEATEKDSKERKAALRAEIWENVFCITRLATDVDELFEFFASRLANLAGSRKFLNDALHRAGQLSLRCGVHIVQQLF